MHNIFQTIRDFIMFVMTLVKRLFKYGLQSCRTYSLRGLVVVRKRSTQIASCFKYRLNICRQYSFSVWSSIRNRSTQMFRAGITFLRVSRVVLRKVIARLDKVGETLALIVGFIPLLVVGVYIAMQSPDLGSLFCGGGASSSQETSARLTELDAAITTGLKKVKTGGAEAIQQFRTLGAIEANKNLQVQTWINQDFPSQETPPVIPIPFWPAELRVGVSMFYQTVGSGLTSSGVVKCIDGTRPLLLSVAGEHGLTTSEISQYLPERPSAEIQVPLQLGDNSGTVVDGHAPAVSDARPGPVLNKVLVVTPDVDHPEVIALRSPTRDCPWVDLERFGQYGNPKLSRDLYVYRQAYLNRLLVDWETKLATEETRVLMPLYKTILNNGWFYYCENAWKRVALPESEPLLAYLVRHGCDVNETVKTLNSSAIAEEGLRWKNYWWSNGASVKARANARVWESWLLFCDQLWGVWWESMLKDTDTSWRQLWCMVWNDSWKEANAPPTGFFRWWNQDSVQSRYRQALELHLLHKSTHQTCPAPGDATLLELWNSLWKSYESTIHLAEGRRQLRNEWDEILQTEYPEWLVARKSQLFKEVAEKFLRLKLIEEHPMYKSPHAKAANLMYRSNKALAVETFSSGLTLDELWADFWEFTSTWITPEQRNVVFRVWTEFQWDFWYHDYYFGSYSYNYLFFVPAVKEEILILMEELLHRPFTPQMKAQYLAFWAMYRPNDPVAFANREGLFKARHVWSQAFQYTKLFKPGLSAELRKIIFDAQVEQTLRNKFYYPLVTELYKKEMAADYLRLKDENQFFEDAKKYVEDIWQRVPLLEKFQYYLYLKQPIPLSKRVLVSFYILLIETSRFVKFVSTLCLIFVDIILLVWSASWFGLSVWYYGVVKKTKNNNNGVEDNQTKK